MYMWSYLGVVLNIQTSLINGVSKQMDVIEHLSYEPI